MYPAFFLIPTGSVALTIQMLMLKINVKYFYLTIYIMVYIRYRVKFYRPKNEAKMTILGGVLSFWCRLWVFLAVLW